MDDFPKATLALLRGVALSFVPSRVTGQWLHISYNQRRWPQQDY